MTATTMLKEEHEAAKLMLKILEKFVSKLTAGERVEPQHLEQLLEFMTGFMDHCHHAKEETCLFPALEAAGVPKEGGPIGVMLMEHHQGREFVQGMKVGLAQYQHVGRADDGLFCRNASQYIQHLTQHMLKEDRVLFPMADAHLSPEQHEELLKDFERLEAEKVGAGRHAQFHEDLQRLATLYLA
jgi:hemerythrin-like domain-containing protein